MAEDEFWTRVRVLLKAEGRSQTWLAHRLFGQNACRQRVNAWITGRRHAPARVKREVALILGIGVPDEGGNAA